MAYRVVFLGPPASGKGTAAEALSVTLKVAHVSTGQLFRDAMAKETPVGLAAKAFIDKGQLAPDEMTIEVVRQWLTMRGTEPEFIFDGFPRTVVQAQAFDAMMAERKLALPIVIFFDVTEEKAIERVLGRRGCAMCGALYHVKLNPPRQAGVCDRCGGELTRRSDDTEETVRERLRVYHRVSAPVVDHYEQLAVLRRLDGEKARQETFKEVLELVRT